MKLFGTLSLVLPVLAVTGFSLSKAASKPLRFPFVGDGHGTYSQDLLKSKFQFEKACYKFVYNAVGKKVSTESHLSRHLSTLCHGGTQKQCDSWAEGLVSSMRLDERESDNARGDLAEVIKSKPYMSWCSKVYDDVTSISEGQKGSVKKVISMEPPAMAKPVAKETTVVSTTRTHRKAVVSTTTTTTSQAVTTTIQSTTQAATTTTTTKMTTTTTKATTTVATSTTTTKAKVATTTKAAAKVATTTKAIRTTTKKAVTSTTTAKPVTKKVSTGTTAKPAATSTKAAVHASTTPWHTVPKATTTAKAKPQAVAKAAPAVTGSAAQSQSKRLRAQTTTNSTAATNSSSNKDCVCVHHHGKKVCHCLNEHLHKH